MLLGGLRALGLAVRLKVIIGTIRVCYTRLLKFEDTSGVLQKTLRVFFFSSSTNLVSIFY